MTRPSARRPRLLIDTDIFSDVDDVGALAVAHALADEGAAEIAAVLVNTPSRWGHRAVQVLNAYYGRAAIPVGALLPLDDSVSERDYARYLAEVFSDGVGIDPPDEAVRVARRCLAVADDASIVVVSLGFFQNLVALLDSPADDISPRSGRDLVTAKVARAVVMGGLFPAGWEFNVGEYPAVAARFCDSWPGEIEFLGWEVGAGVITGAELSREDDPTNPVSLAYRAFSGPGVGRDSWDPMTVLLAVQGVSDDYDYSVPGTVSVGADGATRFRESTSGRHRYVKLLSRAADLASRLDRYLAMAPAARRDLAPTTRESGSPA